MEDEQATSESHPVLRTIGWIVAVVAAVVGVVFVARVATHHAALAWGANPKPLAMTLDQVMQMEAPPTDPSIWQHDMDLMRPASKLSEADREVFAEWVGNAAVAWAAGARFPAGATIGDILEQLRDGNKVNAAPSEPVAAATGEPPACAFMSADSRFQVGPWTDREMEDENGDRWSCVSRYVELGGESLPNNIAYYASGARDRVRQLKLSLNVNVPSKQDAALAYFARSADNLAAAALHAPLPGSVQRALRTGGHASVFVGHDTVTVSKEPYEGGIRGGFTMRCVVSLVPR